MAEVTVVIPNYNGIGYLKDCLDTLREQTCKNYETVLVDNGSTDGSLAFVKEHYPWVKILAPELWFLPCGQCGNPGSRVFLCISSEQ